MASRTMFKKSVTFPPAASDKLYAVLWRAIIIKLACIKSRCILFSHTCVPALHCIQDFMINLNIGSLGIYCRSKKRPTTSQNLYILNELKWKRSVKPYSYKVYLIIMWIKVSIVSLDSALFEKKLFTNCHIYQWRKELLLLKFQCYVWFLYCNLSTCLCWHFTYKKPSLCNENFGVIITLDMQRITNH